MSKKERHKQELAGLLAALDAPGGVADLRIYLLANCNLPGPRGNLELAQAFAELVRELAAGEIELLWRVCEEMNGLSPEQAPVNDPLEFLSFCGTLGVGALGAVCPEQFEPALAILRSSSNDARWRMREGVAMALQQLLASRGRETLSALQTWIGDDNWLEMRAVAAAVADPGLLKKAELALQALSLHQIILDRVLGSREHRSDPFRTLRQGLGYTVSVVICALPEEGFRWMDHLAASGDADVIWIVRSNLKKNRLVSGFPDRVKEIWQRLG